MSEEPVAGDGVQAYTIRLELADEPGELLGALEPIADHGGNLLSIFHERGNVTPRGRIPVEVDLECPPARFEEIVGALRDAGHNVVRAGSQAYAEQVSVVLVGHLVDTDLSDTLSALEACESASVVDMAMSAPEGTEDVSTARVRLAVESGRTGEALATVREVATAKDLRVIEPLVAGPEGER